MEEGSGFMIVDKIIYFYIYVCVLLLVFNIVYAVHSVRQRRRRKRAIRRWKERLSCLEGGDTPAVDAAHLALLRKDLRRERELMAYNTALFGSDPALQGPRRTRYLEQCSPVYRELARYYGRQEPMVRALFAYVMARLCREGCTCREEMAEEMLGYLEQSTVYCREQVLHTLYALGSAQAVEHAFSIFAHQGWNHNSKLIADGLAEFTGDGRELVLLLWEHRTDWPQSLLVGVVGFANALPDDLGDVFAPALLGETLRPEIQFALIRYFGRHPSARVREYLYQAVLHADGRQEKYAIAAAAALRAYPGPDTKRVLKQAIRDRNWYVRKNAAASLVGLGLTDSDRRDVYESGDAYAAEILTYTLEQERRYG